jgi:hypothetical protein
VIDHQVHDDPQAERPRVVYELHEIARSPVLGMHAVIVADVVAVVAIGRRIEGLEPDAGHAETSQIVEPPVQALEIADAVAVRIHVRLDVEAVNDAVLVPEILEHHMITHDASLPSSMTAAGPSPRERRCSGHGRPLGGDHREAIGPSGWPDLTTWRFGLQERAQPELTATR